MLAVGLIAVVFALVEADDWGWDSARTLGLLAGGLAVLAGFWRIEHRIEAPLVDFSLFRNRPYLGATAAAFALIGAYWVVMFFQPQYLQEQLGYSAIEAGALILPVTMPMALFSPLSGGLIARLGPRTTMTAGMLIGVAGLVWQAAAEARPPTRACCLGSCASGSRLPSSTRRCRPRRWRRCPSRRPGSHPEFWR